MTGDQNGSTKFSATLVSAITELARGQGEIAGKLKAMDAAVGRAVTEISQLVQQGAAMDERTRTWTPGQLENLANRLTDIQAVLKEIQGSAAELTPENVAVLKAATEESLERFCPVTQPTFEATVQTCVDKAFDTKIPILKWLASKWLGISVAALIFGLLAVVLILLGARDVKIGPGGLQFKVDQTHTQQHADLLKQMREHDAGKSEQD